MSENVIEISSLTKDYQTGFLKKKTVRALDNLSLSVNRGEIFGFLGANGAGKTTTMKLLMGLIYPTSGTANILGRSITDVESHRRIGYLPEQPYFYDYLTPLELLDYVGQLFGIHISAREQRAKELLDLVHLDQKSWKKQLRKFSKGMLQRVGIAQALMNDPDVVFLDEPMSGLDPIGRREIRDLIAELRVNGKTVFFCTHILSDIETLCDRAAILKKGSLAHYGTIDQLRQQSGAKHVEITLAGVTASDLASGVQSREHILDIHPAPSGVRLITPSEEFTEEILSLTRPLGARLVSVQPAGNPLEDLFT
jgi:ABC-2 type transport system ATP-binding protein